jgi:hypothetical protein
MAMRATEADMAKSLARINAAIERLREYEREQTVEALRKWETFYEAWEAAKK